MRESEREREIVMETEKERVRRSDIGLCEVEKDRSGEERRKKASYFI